MLDDLNLTAAAILIVDDRQENIDLLERILNTEGYKNLTCLTDPREVEKVYRDGDYELVLLDISMPHLDGFQVMEQLHNLGKDDYLPVLVVTALADRDTRLRALSSGAMDFLTKPFDRLEILHRIRNALQVRLLHREVIDQNELLEQRVFARTLELEDQSKELHDTRLEVIRRLGRAAEYRDNETGLHIIRMSNFSRLVAQHAGMGADMAELVLNASPMHDIGKIGIPDGVLLKPGKLESDEWEVMKTHAVIGAEILGGHDSELLGTAQVIARTHHEKWDGSGYPNGLAEEDIPLVGRIVAIADVFDALTSVRPYKEAWPLQEAVNLVEASSGGHFDPSLVPAFKKALPEIVEIMTTYQDPKVPTSL